MDIMETFSYILSLNSVVFLLFSIVLIHGSFDLMRHPLCHNDDRSSLLQLKHSFLFDKFSCNPSDYNYTKLASWNVGVDCSSWDGVDCNAVTGRVIGLDLSSSCLYGSINSSSPLFRLVHLTSLDLSYNNFNFSAIPSALRSMSQLEHLNLTSSNFSGQIPSEMLQLSNLVSLHLSLNSLILQKPSLKDVVETFTHLEKLYLTDVDISSRVPQSLSNLTSLSSLVLNNCSLVGEFPPGAFQLPNLRALSLQYNPYLTGYIPEFDDVSSPLEQLWLDGTNLSGRLPVSIGSLKSLGVFSASKCHLGGVIPSSFGNLTQLHGVDLSRNYFSGRIPSSLGKLVRLTFLDLSHNNFSRDIPSSLQNLTQLTSLLLDFNQLTGPLPSWIGNLTRLINLSIAKNELQGPIPESVFRLPNLQVLYLPDNNLSGSLKYDSFLQMQHLSGLQLSNNQLSLVRSPYMNVTLPKFQFLGLGFCNLREFPTFMRAQIQLEILNLQGNNIEGSVPTWLFDFKSLKYLSLSSNYLTSFEQPLSILSLPNLKGLDLRSNQFEGPLPFPSLSMVIYDVSQNKFSGHISPLFCNLTSALSLDFSSNILSGTLPHCLGNVALVLNLRNNSFSGAIPDNITSGCKLKYMDFSQNMFENVVPRSLAECFELEILNLDENRINDAFPYWLGILPHLRVLSLRSNKFHGEIGQPLNNFEFGRLHIIDLSGNKFTGKLPREYFRNWVSIRNVDEDNLAYMRVDTSFEMPGYRWTADYNYSITIMNKGTKRAYDRILEFFVVVDLSSNRFEGEIPEIIGSLRALQSLNLSNNMFTGHIPLSLGNLTMLEALDLSQNNLSGKIPVQLTSVTTLEVFNVSHNNLTGPIPKGNQFGTFDNSSFSDNPRLCGDILPKKCGKTETSQLPPSKGSEEDDESPFQFNWQIVLIGFGTGLVIGVAFGWALDTRKYEWFVKKKFARRVRRRRRN